MDLKEFQQLALRLRPRLVADISAMLGDGLRAETADDIVQETLVKLWGIRDRLESVRSVYGMALTVARHRCIDLLRSERVRRVDIAFYEATDPAEQSAMEAIIENENALAADRILSQLPPLQQAVMRMRHVDGLEINEIAAITGTSPNAVRVNLSRARHTVRDIFLNRTL